MATTFELSSVADELRFWKNFVRTKRFRGWTEPRVTPELNPFVRDFIMAHVKHGDKVLDVGSGVVSILNGLVDVVAVDPLAELYEFIFNYGRLKRPIPLAGEDMPFKDEYKIVHTSNAIDHSINPSLFLRKLADACSPGGYVIVQCFENEADHQAHRGLHQWNISLQDNYLAINNAPEVLNNVEVVTAKIETLDTGRRWIMWIAKKL